MIKVLLVDDDLPNLRLLEAELEDNCGLKKSQLRTAQTGEKGMEIFKQEDFDLVVLDFNLPGIDGLEVYKKMKDLRPKTAVMMFSGYRDNYPGIPEENCAFKSFLGLDELLEYVRTQMSGGT
jgi:YesN/AraC family two-component response regulator